MHRWLLSFCSLALFTSSAAAQTEPEIEFKIAGETLQGKSIAHDKHRCWLMSDDGRLHEVRLANVQSFRKVSDRFRPQSLIDVRDTLRKEYGGRMEVATRGEYVVCGPRGKAVKYAELLDAVHSSFTTYFSRRQFKLAQPEFPLVVLVFPTREEFVAYADAERTAVADTLQGYYNLQTNRVALFEDARLGSAANGEGLDGGAELPPGIAASIEAGPLDTLIHEAIHQLAFNTSLHSRIGENPRWVVEGLAMLFEEETRREGSRGTLADRVNRSRYVWFMNSRQERRPARHLESFLQNDESFNTATLDAYSEAWALSFYLIETRPTEYSKYLRTIAARDPLTEYTKELRLADFRAAFAKDVNWFEGQYLRYLDDVELK
jgi:hypothetical protein